MTIVDKAKKAAAVVVTLGVVAKVIGASVERDDNGTLTKVRAFGIDIFSRRRMEARQARRAARRERP